MKKLCNHYLINKTKKIICYLTIVLMTIVSNTLINIVKVMLACNILKEIGGGGSRQLGMYG